MAHTGKHPPPTAEMGEQDTKENEELAETPGPALEGEALFAALKDQIDYYFSRQNLSKDSFLLSQMDEQRFVKVDLIANFRKVKNLTEDRELIIEAMRQCKNLTMDSDETRCKPSTMLEAQRNVLILRDIPADTPVADIQDIFAKDENCGKVTDVRSDIGDTWFVTFETEDECMDTAMHLSNVQFQGKPIRCRVKSANVQRSFFVPPAAAATRAGAQPNFYGANPYQGGNPYAQAPGTGGQYAAPYMYANQNFAGQWQQAQGYVQGNAGANGGQQKFPGERKPRNKKNGEQNQNVEGEGQPKKNNRNNNPEWNKQTRRGKAGARAKNDAGRTREPKPAAPTPAPPPADLDNTGDFPALPGKQGSGYDGASFKRYERETIAEAIIALTKLGFKKPADMLDEYPIVSATVVTESQLLEPMPVIYPASPSPLLAAQTRHSSQLPFLDLNSYGNPYLPPDNPQGSFSAAVELAAPEEDAKEAPKAEAKEDDKPEAAKPKAAAASPNGGKGRTNSGERKGSGKGTQGNSRKGARNKEGGQGGSSRKAGTKSPNENKGGQGAARGEKGGNPSRRGRATNKYAQKPSKAGSGNSQSSTPNRSPNLAASSAPKSEAPSSPSKFSYAQMIMKGDQ